MKINDKCYEDLQLDLFKIFENEFKDKGYELFNFIDLNVWFMKNKSNEIDEFIELGQTPGNQKIKSNETDFIIGLFFSKFLQLQSNMKESNNKDKSKVKINVKVFIDEINKFLINLYKDVKRVNRLIKKYKAYETLNLIEYVKFFF